MIDMEVGPEDEVDFLTRNASPLDSRWTVGRRAIRGRDHGHRRSRCRQARRAHQERVDADQQPPGHRLDESVAEPRALLFDFLGRRVANQSIAIESEARQLRNLLYRDESKSLRAHGALGGFEASVP